MAASLSILGLYEWNEGIFDNLELPDGIDRDILIPEIVTQCSDFCLLYPDYDFMRMLIGVWSKKEKRIWEDLLRSETFEYNPIENYDRFETETSGNTRQHSGVDSTSESVQGSSVTDGENSRTILNTTTTSNSNQGSGSDSQTTTNEITAFDSNALVTHDRSATTGQNSSTLTQNGTETQSGTDTLTDDTTVTNTESKTGSFTHGEKIADSASRESHIHGNIGVTTSQQMLESEIAISEKLNVYDYIVQEFKRRFCILVY